MISFYGYLILTAICVARLVVYGLVLGIRDVYRACYSEEASLNDDRTKKLIMINKVSIENSIITLIYLVFISIYITATYSMFPAVVLSVPCVILYYSIEGSIKRVSYLKDSMNSGVLVGDSLDISETSFGDNGKYSVLEKEDNSFIIYNKKSDTDFVRVVPSSKDGGFVLEYYEESSKYASVLFNYEELNELVAIMLRNHANDD